MREKRLDQTIHVRISGEELAMIDYFGVKLKWSRSKLIRVAIRSLLGWLSSLEAEELARYYFKILQNLSTDRQSEAEYRRNTGKNR